MKKRIEGPAELLFGPTAGNPSEAPNPPTEGWWLDPSPAPDGVSQRFYDGSKWTDYVSDLFGSTWGRIREQAYSTPSSAETHASCPPPARIPVYPPDPPGRGWWTDPYRPGLRPDDPTRSAEGPLCQRFHDGERWTPHISYRMPGPPDKRGKVKGTTSWGDVTEDPDPLGQPAPKLGVRTIDDYQFLPPAMPGEKPPEEPTIGWWADPFNTFGERFHDGARWTQYRRSWSRYSGEHLYESPAGPRPVPPPVEYNPGPLRTDRAFSLTIVALVGGLIVLGASTPFDRQGQVSSWTARVGLLSFVAGFAALLTHVGRMAFPPKSAGRTDTTNVLYGVVLLLIFGAGIVALRDPVLRALWLR